MMIIDWTDLKENLSEYLTKLSDEEEIYILRDGKPVAKLVEYTHLTDYDLHKENTSAYDYSSKEISYDEFIIEYEKTEERLEYINGKVYVMGSPSHTHQSIIRCLSGNFFIFFKGKKCQPYTAAYDVHFETSENKACVQPDIFIMCDQENVVDEKYYGISTLVVEVISPSSRSKDTLTKLNLYQREGVSEYLLVDPKNLIFNYYYFEDKEIVVYDRLGIDDLFESNVFKGLRIDIKEVFNI